MLAYPGCFASEVFGIPDLLTIAGHVAGASEAVVSTVSPREHVIASGGVRVAVAPVDAVDLLVVPGFELTPNLDLDARLASLAPEMELIDAHHGALATVCVGAFLAAEAGVLDGRKATTSWLFADALARRYPAVDVQAERLVVTDGGVTTTEAFSAMYDLALTLIRGLHGESVARRTARIALVDDARASQAPYVEPQLLAVAADTLSGRVKQWLDRNVAASYHLSSLAQRFHVSSRTLLRQFRAETGHTPLQYLQLARVREACRLLEATDLAVGAIADSVGYRDPGALTEIFNRYLGQTPRHYRSTFRRR